MVLVKRKRIELRDEAFKRPKSRSRSQSPQEEQKRENSEEKRHHRTTEKKKLKWVTNGIIARVISKTVADGKLYEKKVRITHILDEYSFEALSVEANLSYTRLSERDLETVLPSSKKLDDTSVVKIVYGKHKNRTGKVVSIDKKRDKVVV
jgi:hypothetical protein